MLCLSRNVEERIHFEVNGVQFSVVVMSVKGKQVSLGIDAPPEVKVDRKQEWLQVKRNDKEDTKAT